MPIKQL